MMVISLFAFLLLNFWPGCTEEHAENRLMVATHDELENQRSQSPSPSTKSIENDNLNTSKRPIFLLLLIQSFVCFISNGAFPSIQTYSCLPYGNLVYHLSVTLNAMVNPAMAFFSFFVPCTKLKSILALTGVGTLLSFFLLATALTSPGMLGGQSIGGTFTVNSLNFMFEFEVTTLNTEETFSIQIIPFFTHIFEICEAVHNTGRLNRLDHHFFKGPLRIFFYAPTGKK